VVGVMMMIMMIRNYKNSRILHCMHTWECTNFQVQNIQHSNVTCTIKTSYRIAGTLYLYILETWFVSAVTV
jgi:sorbitol-specific phosphotransferase system component IIBC